MAKRAQRRVTQLLAAASIGALLSGCALLTPLPNETTLDQRLAAMPTEGLPLKGETVIYWDPHQVPYIEAEHDEDAAFALGLVHAHLRLGQMEIFRRISQGRIAEMGGPLAVEIDHGLRLIDFGRASAESAAAMPPETRRWMEHFVAGLNHYQQNVERLPVEYAILGFEREPWTIEELLTFGRLAGTDVNWLVWFNVLRLREREDWPEIWGRLVENGSASTTSFARNGDVAVLNELLAGLSRSGSNSLAIAGDRSASGGAIMANDPHLGVNQPNTWLLAGVKSPSYHAVGMMIPGLPFFAIGRNPWIAWGGTNMRAASSELYDISGLPPEAIEQRQAEIGVRWWFDSDVTLRDTEIGPVLSDAPQLSGLNGPAFALRWTGHLPSDEVTAMLKVSQARDFESFRDAFASFAVPGQNMLYADNDGNIGQVMAVQLPNRNGAAPGDVILDPAERLVIWDELQGVQELPHSYNPEEGYLVSANNRPAKSDVQIGYFFSPDDRVERMRALIGPNGKVGIDEMKALQRDVFMPSSVALRDLWLAKLDESGVAATATGQRRELLDLMTEWDGHYRTDSRGAVAYELFRHAFTTRFYQLTFGEQDWAAFANVGRIKALLLEDLEKTPARELDALLLESLAAASERLDDFENWGDMHRLQLAHPLSFLPLIGNRFTFGDFPVGGSSDTLMKTAHAATDERHRTRYGSNSRHVSDLSDIDLNYFVLLGGQDGWLNSSTFSSQVPLWLEGEYIQMPLRLDRVRDSFTRRMELHAE